MDKSAKGSYNVYPEVKLVSPAYALIACCWHAREGNFGVTCFTPEGIRVWRLRNLTHEAAEDIAHRYWRWLDSEER
jgi:hypothetical protein